MPLAFLLRDARHAMHDILLLRISAILPEAISAGGLTPTTDTDLLLATYRGGSHLTSDIKLEPRIIKNKNIKGEKHEQKNRGVFNKRGLNLLPESLSKQYKKRKSMKKLQEKSFISQIICRNMGEITDQTDL